jgi:glycosyltransferase involved in cell wall biosynthesis
VRDRSGLDLADFKRWAIAKDIELIIFNEQRTWKPILFCQEVGIKTVAYVDYYRERDVQNFANYDALICNTERHYSVFDWHPGAIYMPWGTDTELFSPRAKKEGLVNDGLVTFFHSAGRSPDRKGTDFLLKAFDRVRGEAKLVIHTQVPLESRFPEIGEVVERLVRNGKLECVVETVPAPGLYHRGDVYVYPTRLDGIGLTVCEALACGLPVIVPECGPMNEFVTEEGTGAVIKIDRYVSRWDAYYWPQCIVNVENLFHLLQKYVDDLLMTVESKRLAREYAEEFRDWKKNTGCLSEKITRVIIWNSGERDDARLGVENLASENIIGDFYRNLKMLIRSTIG